MEGNRKSSLPDGTVHNPQRAQRRAERTTTNKVWGSAITNKHSTRKPSSFDSKRKPFSKAPERKVRVFGPNGVKDL